MTRGKELPAGRGGDSNSCLRPAAASLYEHQNVRRQSKLQCHKPRKLRPGPPARSLNRVRKQTYHVSPKLCIPITSTPPTASESTSKNIPPVPLREIRQDNPRALCTVVVTSITTFAHEQLPLERPDPLCILATQPAPTSIHLTSSSTVNAETTDDLAQSPLLTRILRFQSTRYFRDGEHNRKTGEAPGGDEGGEA